MTRFVLAVPNRMDSALDVVWADSLPAAEAMGRALYDHDVIAYHACQMPAIADRLLLREHRADVKEAAASIRYRMMHDRPTH